MNKYNSKVKFYCLGESLFDQLELIKEKILKENEEAIENLDEVQQFYYYQNIARKIIDPHESLKKKLNTVNKFHKILLLSILLYFTF